MPAACLCEYREGEKKIKIKIKIKKIKKYLSAQRTVSSGAALRFRFADQLTAC